MTDAKPNHAPWLQSFWVFVAHLFPICFVFRGVLEVQLILVLCGGLAVSRCEEISAWKGSYFAMITSTSVGYGDIAPEAVICQCISVVLALISTVFFGLAVADATRAVEVTVRDYRDTKGQGPRASWQLVAWEFPLRSSTMTT